MVQGVLSNGAVASLSLVLATKDTPSSISWIITGEKASLKFEGPNINIQMIPPELFLHAGAGKEWEKIEITPAFAFGQVGELYEAIADGEKTKGCLVDLEGATLRHRMLEACARSSESGTRETYTIEA
jgi:predicted dehydrogenase